MKHGGDYLDPVIAVFSGSFVAAIISPHDFGRADEILVTLLSLAVAGTFPAVVLTASAARPAVKSADEAVKVGGALKEQVNFWTGILLWGILSVGSLFIAHSHSWNLSTPRLSLLPSWVPRNGGRWFVFLSASLSALTGLRVLKVGNEIKSIIDLATKAQILATKNAAAEEEKISKEALRYNGPLRGQPIDRRAS